MYTMLDFCLDGVVINSTHLGKLRVHFQSKWNSYVLKRSRMAAEVGLVTVFIENVYLQIPIECVQN